MKLFADIEVGIDPDDPFWHLVERQVPEEAPAIDPPVRESTVVIDDEVLYVIVLEDGP